jgi:E1A/CREB-binding protein
MNRVHVIPPDEMVETELQVTKLRAKQRRLLILHHAFKCTHATCTESRHCASMKKLWSHMAHCRDQACGVPHCLSSRYVLSHYRRCQNTLCSTCGPVRLDVKRELKLVVP